MVIETLDNGDFNVKLYGGGLYNNLGNIWANMTEDEQQALTTIVFNDPENSLNSPDVYTIGTLVIVHVADLPTDSKPTSTPTNG
jgi:hypothetical protein